jgi:multiple sugar transport system substrate-binding protein
MASIRLRGITWSHRRAIDPLLATLSSFRSGHPDIDVDWSSRSLHGFEFAPIDELARSFDLVVLDHPFVGHIAATGCLEALDPLFTDELRSSFVGPSLESYVYGGRTWAMPIDAACQVAAVRPDLLGALDRDVPRTWEAMFALGSDARRRGQWLAIGLKGVHGLMTLFTLCANLGRPCGVTTDEPLFDEEAARAALDGLRRLLSYCPPDVLDWNSIALHDQMVGRDDLVYCPAVYCYATYAEADMRRPLRFYDLPGLTMATASGSTIGGTGVGLSAWSRHADAARTYIRYLAQGGTQMSFAEHHGQPARREVWSDPAIDARFGSTYSSTRYTTESAWIRPRYPGYLSLQYYGGELVERHLRGQISASFLLQELERLHRTPTDLGGHKGLHSGWKTQR